MSNNAPSKGFINRFKNSISYDRGAELVSNYAFMAYTYFLLINDNDKRIVALIPISVVLQLVLGMYGPSSLDLGGVFIISSMNMGFLINKYQREGTDASKKHAFTLGLSTLLFLMMLGYLSDKEGGFGNMVVYLIKNFIFVGLGAAFAMIDPAAIKLPGQ